LVLQRLLEHAGDLLDVDDVELERPRARGINRLGAVGAGQAEQPVDGPHAGPGQRDVEDPVRVDTDREPGRGCLGLKRLDVAQRVVRGARGQVRRVGRASAGRLARVGLDQLPAVVELDQPGVGAGVQVPADQLARHRVERLGHLDVPVPGHLRRREHRHVIDPVGGWQQ
jgi:hypothetical protein